MLPVSMTDNSTMHYVLFVNDIMFSHNGAHGAESKTTLYLV